MNNVFHILGESNSDKVQKFKRWFWFIVEKMSLQERQDLVRHCVYYTAIVLFWLPILSKFEQAKHICTYTFYFHPFFHANKYARFQEDTPISGLGSLILFVCYQFVP